LPLIMRIFTRSGYAQLLTTYYWDTIAQCIEPIVIAEILDASGFDNVKRRIYGRIFSEYTGLKSAR